MDTTARLVDTGRPAPSRWRQAMMFGVVLVIGLLARPAVHAQGGDAARANAIYKDAKERFEANDFQKAYELATEAERLFAHPSITFLKGRAMRKIGKLREAEEALKQADSPQLPKALQRPLTEERLGLAEEFRLKGELKVLVQPPSAIVSVDGDAGKGDYARWVLVGKRRVEVAAPGYRPVVRVVELVPGETSEIKVNLSPLGGTLVVIAPGGLRGVEILIDGVAIDVPEGARVGDRAPPLPVSVGSHEVQCLAGERRVNRTVQVEVDASVEVTCDGIGAAGVAAGKAVGWSGVALGAMVAGYGAWGLSSFYLVDVDDPRGVQTSNKPVLGTVYTLTGVATGVLSYLLFVRDSGGESPADSGTASVAGASGR